MERRAFLKQSAVGIGALAGVCGGLLKAEEGNLDHPAAITEDSSGHGFAGMEEESQFVWGTNAVVLKSPWSKLPSVDGMLADREHTLLLNRFYRVAGENRPATPTDCCIAYTNDLLLVAFRCEEKDMSFPYANLDGNWWSEANWHSLHGLPSAANNWPPYPDELDLLIQPDPSIPTYYQFAATPQGLKFGLNRSSKSNAEVGPDEAASERHSQVRASKVDAFTASVTRRADEWLVLFQIPWQTLGGKPKSHFGFLPLRTRWRDGEFSSPAAIDLNECMPVDLQIETHFEGAAEVKNAESNLCELPSGILRWRRPARLTYPDVEMCQQIWHMES